MHDDNDTYASDAAVAARLERLERERASLLRFIEEFVREYDLGARSGEWYVGDARRLLASLKAARED